MLVVFLVSDYKDLHKANQLLLVVDDSGKLTGETVKRWEAHSMPGVKHLAFAVFVLNKKKEFVLHLRPGRKVGGNQLDTPVSHVLAGETKNEAILRCLKEEYGIAKKIPLEHFGGFSYFKDYGDSTCENEFCLVILAKHSGKIAPNPKEVVNSELFFLPAKKALLETKKHPEKFTVWFNKSIELLSKDALGKKLLQ